MPQAVDNIMIYSILTCICLRLTCTKLHLSLTLLTKTRDIIASATDMCIVYHVTLVEASRNVNLGTRYDSRCVDAECGTRNGEGGEGDKEISIL